MAERLFYCYLKYQKGHNINIWKKLIKLPWHIPICTVMLFAAITATFVLWFFPTFKNAQYICGALTVIICIIMYIITERFQINTSNISMSKYQTHCTELRKWLNENNIKTDYEINLLHKRLIEHINEKKAERKEQNDRVDKWTQTLAIPVLLAIITTMIDKGISIQDSIFFSLGLVFIFAICCCIVWFMKIMIQFPDKQKLEQMNFFADDLQVLLDLNSNNKKCYSKPKTKMENNKKYNSHDNFNNKIGERQ